MDRFFSSPKIFDHLWTANTETVGTVTPNRKEMPKELFPEKQKKGEKWTTQRDHLLAIKWRDVLDVYLLSTAHDDRMVETPASREAHQKTKRSAVLDYNKYKIGVDKSDQMLSYYSFHRKSVKWWKKLFFHLFDLALVNAHILHQKKYTKKFRLHKFTEKVAEGLVSDMGREVTEQSWLSSASRLVGSDHFVHRVLAMSSKLKGCSKCTCKVCADRRKHYTSKSTKKYTTIYCRKCDVSLYLGDCFKIYHTKVNYWD
jgi:hypothetical protein